MLSRIFFVILGLFFLFLGIIGILLPVLPTTPFLLAASFCFLKGSSRLHLWLTSHPVWGPRIERIRNGGGLTLKEKIISFSLAFCMITPIIIFSSSLHLRIFLAVLLIVKAIVFIRIRTAKFEDHVKNQGA